MTLPMPGAAGRTTGQPRGSFGGRVWRHVPPAPRDEMEPGMIQYLPAGATVTFAPPRPSAMPIPGDGEGGSR